ncbi:MAG: hypothetical protein DHS20C11_09250 [Lysobacteraceae bacterium]|nr:MAG: hypothetical protein DHS20C11_09250 [Xanthomonadaceae bacterium]
MKSLFRQTTALGIVLTSLSANAQILPVREFYIPVDEQHIRDWSDAISPNTNNPPASETVRSFTSLVFSTDNSVVTYDHWEDGYEADITNPVQASTEIWGDVDASTGLPPGCATVSCDRIGASDLIILDNNIPVPRVAGNQFYDARDYVASTGTVVLSRHGYRLQEGSLLGGAGEVFPVGAWGTSFEAPVGEDISSHQMFQYTAASIISSADGTTVTIDRDGNGSTDITQVLARGESMVVQDITTAGNGILTGATINATNPIQVYLLTGDRGTTYAGRWYSLVPSSDWSTEYYSPAGSSDPDPSDTDQATFIIAYNPNGSAITVNHQTRQGGMIVNGNFSVPAGGHFNFRMPEGSGGRFFTPGGETFYALSAIDFDSTASDWGFPLVQSGQLTTSVVVGLGWGQVNSAAPPAENSSPVWVTAVADTTLYVDYDSDPNTGSLLDPNGDLYDQQIAFNALESLQIRDIVDGDQSQLKLYTLDNTLITAAWGQDPATASPADPALDMGTFIIPFPDIDVLKVGILVNDLNGDGGIDPGDTIKYSIDVTNKGVSSNQGVITADTLDPNTTYVENTTEVDGGSIADDSGGGATPFPLDDDGVNAGYDLGDIGPGQTVNITFNVTVNDPLVPVTTSQIFNHVKVTASEEVVADTDLLVIGDPELTLTKTSSAGGNPVAPGDTITYTIELSNVGTSTTTGVQMLDFLPTNATYDANTTVASAPTLDETWRDEFDAVSYANNNGTSNWTNNWQETDPLSLDVDGPTPGTGQVMCVFPFAPDCNGGNCLAMTADYSGAAISVQGMALSRIADLSTAVAADLTFTHSYFDLEAGVPGSVHLEIRPNSGTAWTRLDTFDYGVSNFTDQPEAYDITAYISATTEIRFLGEGLAVGAKSFDDIQIHASFLETKTNAIAASNPLLAGTPTQLVLAADGFDLDASETLTVTYDVTVNDPQAPGNAQLINTAQASSAEAPNPLLAVVSDPLHSALVTGLVWVDADGDGFQDVVEPGIGEVTVTLEVSDGMGGYTTYATIDTDANGEYAFYYLPPGDYRTRVDGADIPAGLSIADGSSNPRTQFTLSAGEHQENEDFGYWPTNNVAIGDTVFADANGNGVQDSGEAGIGNVTVRLINAATGVATGDTATTDAMGRYLFTNIAPGQYSVEVTDTNNELTGYSNTTGGETSAPVTLFAGESSLDADFGYDIASLRSITDRVWFDLDGDGILDGNESGINGTTVKLLDNSGNVVATTQTDSNGQFTFSGLPDGDYSVVVTDTGDTLQGLNGTTSFAVAGTRSHTLAGSDLSLTSYGYGRPSSITGTVFSDADNDEIRDPNESVIPGTTVILFQDTDGDGNYETQVDTQVTDAMGFYAFTGLPPGNYYASVNNAQPSLSGYSPTTTDQQVGVIGTQINATLGIPNGGVTGVDFGYINSSLPDVSGNVWHDLDADGVDDGAGEPRLAGITLALVDDNGVVVATTTTDSNGDYTFPDVAAGDYSVDVTDRASLLSGFLLTSGFDSIDITVASSDITDIDFGYVRERGDSSLGGTVWLDADHDGSFQPTEGRIANVDVELYDVGPDGAIGGGDDTLVATTTTDASGDYVFHDLAAGNYYTAVDDPTLPSGLSISPLGPTDPSIVVPLSKNETRLDINFGYISAANSLLGDQVWADANGNGLLDPGEVGIAGVEIDIVATGGGFSTTVTTDSLGRWLLPNVAPGEYYLEFDPATLPAGFDPTPTNADETWVVDVMAGTDYLHLDWGFEETTMGAVLGTVSGTVFLDSNANANQNPGEPGISIVTVSLLDSSGNVVASMMTDAAGGDYAFTGVPAGTYSVAITDANGVLVGLNQTTTSPPQFVLPPGGSQTDLDFGFAPSAGTGTIGSQVWHDLDNDGFRDVGEPGMQGVTIDLWHDRNNDGVIEPGVDNFLRSATSDANGEYQFTGLVAGNYLVTVADAAGVTNGFTLTAPTPAQPGVDNYSQLDPYDITLTSGSPNDFTADFGYNAAADLTISGTAFVDANNNGTLDGETGVETVTLSLYRDLDGDGVLDSSDAFLGTQVTPANGTYSFTNLPPGDFLVVANTTGTAVFGYAQTTQTGTGGIQPVTLVAADSPDNDFGYYDGGVTPVPVTLGHFVSWQASDGLQVQWTTMSETSNVGFQLYGEVDGRLLPLGELVPSTVQDSVTPTSYSMTVSASVDRLWLADIDITGQHKRHGPFELTREYGGIVPAASIDWPAIRAEHANAVRGAQAAAAVELLVESDGIYRVDWQQLADAGWVINGVDASELALTENGQAVAIHVEPSEGLFGPGSSIEFVGRGIKTLYSETNVYRLQVDSANAVRVERDNSYVEAVADDAHHIATQRYAPNLQYGFASPLADPWYAQRLLYVNNTPQTFGVDFDVDRPIARSEASIGFELWGVTQQAANPDHHLRADFNGVEVAEISGDGLAAINRTIPVTAAAGMHSVDLTITGEHGLAVDVVNIEAITMQWQRQLFADSDRFDSVVHSDRAGPDPDIIGKTGFESSEPFPGIGVQIDGYSTDSVVAYALTPTPVRLQGTTVNNGGSGFAVKLPALGEGTRYLVQTASSVQSPTLRAIEADDDLMAGPAQYLMISHSHFIDNLAPLVDYHQLNGLAVKVTDVAAVYRRYSGGVVDATAIQQYIRDMYATHGTQYVLLVGGDSYDYHNNLGLGSISLVPTLYRPTSQVLAFTPSDQSYADVDGDLRPDLAIGRLPARTHAELQAMIGKTIDYAGKAYQSEALFAAGPFSEGVAFDTQSDALIDALPDHWIVDRAYLDQLPSAAARQTIINRINQGLAFTGYTGHAAASVWNFPDVLMGLNDVSSLQNEGRPTVVAQFSCWNSYFVDPYQNTIALRFLNEGDHGAAAVMGSTGLSQVESNQLLGNRLMPLLTIPGTTVGDAVMMALDSLGSTHPGQTDVLLGFTLLGDPALVIEP